MKSKDTLKWFPAQLPEVRIILGDAVVEVAKQGRPINTRTLLDYIEGNIKKKSWLDNKELLQTAISVLKDNQNLMVKCNIINLLFIIFHFNNILLHFSTTKQLEIWLK